MNQLPSYPNPQIIPGYHYYYAANNGHIPLPYNLSSTTSSSEQQPNLSNQFPTKFYQNFIPTPMGPIFSALQHVRNQHYQTTQTNHHQSAAFQDPKSVCLRPGCVKAVDPHIQYIFI
ncbi:hypothetical protein BLA29_002772 [Euroglyphus maynei]|uniref:Uncharacterized protein n=1 Tax=Euroglyphus maynei TaxID=6958 RepID=A0A1Y3BLR3_EURMA|nr:hypothetical protein BLA29_002772 [Euroglyphus maynei]